jgi:UDP-N-acetylmuramoylalanine--D-glutamate ligase
LVMGLGSFGGGAGAAKALANLGADVTVTDLRSAEQLPEALALLQGLPIQTILGEHTRASFEKAEVVIVNPAVPANSPWLQIARECHCTLTSEVELALTACADVPCTAITGTHGKSTTSALLAHLVQDLLGRTVLAGNLGGSLLEKTQGLTADDRLVLELSSFQLDGLLAPSGWPSMAILTCLREDHLDRHQTVEAYAAAKQNLLTTQDEHCRVFLPEGEPFTQAWAQKAKAAVTWTRNCWKPEDIDLSPSAALPFPETYRQGQIQAAVEVAITWGVPTQTVEKRLADFPGLPHRMESLPAPEACEIWNNGVATHPEPTAEALRHLPQGAILLAGGKDKGLCLKALAEAAEMCDSIHLFGKGGQRLAEELVSLNKRELFLYPTTAEAMDGALQDLRPDHSLLFSPSFSSFDEFKNFQERAILFQEKCGKLKRYSKRSK